MQLSEHLSLAEFSYSDTAKRKGINNEPSGEHLEAAKVLAENVFEPIRNHFDKPIFISSGYRSAALNKAIGGAATSQHSKGEAIDIDMDGHKGPTNTEVFNFIKDNIKFDQLIAEMYDEKTGNMAWVHVSYTTKKPNRNEVLKMKKVNGKTVYEKFI